MVLGLTRVLYFPLVTQPRYLITPVPSVSGALGSSPSRLVLAERFNCINVTGFFHRAGWKQKKASTVDGVAPLIRTIWLILN